MLPKFKFYFQFYNSSLQFNDVVCDIELHFDHMKQYPEEIPLDYLCFNVFFLVCFGSRMIANGMIAVLIKATPRGGHC